MEMLSVFASREDMEQILEMGAAGGLQQAVGQMKEGCRRLAG